jgi:DNA-directed RNA polymerase subunit L
MSLSALDVQEANVVSPDVEFCGYSIPHPSEAKMNLRIQTYGKF